MSTKFFHGWAIQVGLVIFLFLNAGCSPQSTPASATPTQPPEPVQQSATPTQKLEPTKPPQESKRLNEDTLHLAWTYQADSPINDSPMRVGSVVLAAPVGGPLLALDAETGELRWQFDPDGKVWERSLATDGERFFIGTEGGQIVALNAETGEVEWQKALQINVQIAPHVVENILYVPTTFVGPGLKAAPTKKAKLFALSTTNGQEIWSFETDNYILQTPFYHNEMLYAGGSYYDPTVEVDEGGPMRVYALSSQNGEPQWVYQSEDGFVKALYATDKVLSYIAYQDFTSGVDTKTGELLWRRDTGNWVPSLSGKEDTVYFGSANTVIHALNMNSGEPIWQFNIGGDSFNYALGAPVFNDDSLYFLTQKGNIIALNRLDGSLQWQFPTEIVGSRDGLIVVDDWLYIGDGEGQVYGFTSSDSGL